MNKAYVINLDRSVDRLQTITTQLNNVGLSYERFEAVDGTKLTKNNIKEFTHPLCYNLMCSSGMIGCAMSHYNLWKKMLKEEKEWMFIIEDDANPVIDIVDRLKKIEIMTKQNSKLFDKPAMIYLHCLADCYDNELNSRNIIIDMLKLSGKILSNKPETYEILQFNDMRLFVSKLPMSFQAYIINNKAAKEMVNHIDKYGLRHHIDMITSINPNITTYSVYKPLFNSGWDETTLSNKYVFPKFPTTIAGLYNKKLEWTLNESVMNHITAGAFIYLLLFIILWILKISMKKWIIGLLMIEMILMVKINYF